MDTWNTPTDLRGWGGGGLDKKKMKRVAKEHICVAHGHTNSVIKGGGCVEVGKCRGAAGETSVKASTIKGKEKKKKQSS